MLTKIELINDLYNERYHMKDQLNHLNDYRELTGVQKDLVNEQKTLMNDYLKVLEKRINNLNGE